MVLVISIHFRFQMKFFFEPQIRFDSEFYFFFSTQTNISQNLDKYQIIHFEKNTFFLITQKFAQCFKLQNVPLASRKAKLQFDFNKDIYLKSFFYLKAKKGN